MSDHRTDAPEPGDERSGEPSKTQRKNEALELRELGRALAGLPEADRAALDLPEALRESIERYNAIRKHGAKKRELQYLGKQMRRIDPAPIRAAVEAREAGSQADAAALHRVERWRERLIEDDAAVTAFVEEHPDCDVQQLRSLVRAARREGGVEDPEQRHGKNYRTLFRFLRDQAG
ncbi:ribosome biogenesis factor YjgA [Halomonas denitrificans]|nr:DUF615 domain-containing protein [Halomonas denitrificans]